MIKLTSKQVSPVMISLVTTPIKYLIPPLIPELDGQGAMLLLRGDENGEYALGLHSKTAK